MPPLFPSKPIVVAPFFFAVLIPFFTLRELPLVDMPIAISYNSYDLANELKQVGFSLIGADTEGFEIKDANRQSGEKIALFLGNEAQGLSGKLKKKLDLKVSIKMENDFDSLNVSVAAGILIYALK